MQTEKQILQELFSTPVGRRVFLKKSVLGFCALSLASLLPVSCAPYRRAKKKLKVLSEKELHIAEEAAAALVPFDSEGLPEPKESGAAYTLDGVLGHVSGEVQTQMKLLFLLLEHTPFFFGGGMKRFSGLSLERRRKILSRWEQNPLPFVRLGFYALKTLLLMSYYTGPKTWQGMGYDGPWAGRIPIPEIEPPLANL